MSLGKNDITNVQVPLMLGIPSGGLVDSSDVSLEPTFGY